MRMSVDSSYASRLIHFMLTKERGFIPFRSCYYLLYQCLVPNTREALSLLVQHYSVPKDFERSILSGENPRVCNQGILNYLLIKLRTNKDFVKFWSTVTAMIKEPELRVAVERLRKQKGLNGPVESTIPLLLPLSSKNHLGNKSDDVEIVSPSDERALSVIDDNYCVSYIVTVVDVRSCTRPPRLPQQPSWQGGVDVDVISSLTVAQQMLVTNNSFTELQSHYSVLVRSMPDDYMNTVNQLERHLTGDHIGSILECRDVFTANQRILDCLIEQLEIKEDTFDLCNWLSLITNAPLLTVAIEDLKIDVINGIKMDESCDVTSPVDVETSLNSLRLNDLSTPLNVLSPGVVKIVRPNVFNSLPPGKFGPRALEVLKKHYHTLWRCFPDDYMSTIATMCEQCTVGENIVELITSLQTPEECNRTILDYVICITKGDDEIMAFCNLMEKFINNTRFSKIISEFKQDCTNIMIHGWIQNLLVRRSNSPTDGSKNTVSSAQAEVLPSTTKAVTTFREDVSVVTSETSTTGEGPLQLDVGDIGASVIDHLPAGVSTQCRTMLHSHYDTLWQSFPQDHLITLSRLCDLLPVEEKLMQTIASYSSSEVANKRILNAAISNVKHDSVLLGFCVLVEKLIEDPEKSRVIEKLRSDCLRVMEKKSNVVIKPSIGTGDATQDEEGVAIATPVSVESEVPLSEQVDDADNEDNDVNGSSHGDPVPATATAPATAPPSVASIHSGKPTDPDPLVLHVLPSAVTAECIAVLKKYYNIILESLPDDHTASISLLSENAPVDEGFFSEILSTTDCREANCRILNAVILMMKEDRNIIGLCKLVAMLVGSKRFSKEILEFEAECLRIGDKEKQISDTATTHDVTTGTSNVEPTSTTGGNEKSAPTNNGETVTTTQSEDVEPHILQRLSFSVTPECRLLLKRYYNFLWKNFPQDHLVSLGRLCKLVPLSDDVVDIIVSSSPSEGNQKLLNICMVTIENNKCLPRFCSLVEQIIDNPKLSQLLKIFREECERVVEKTTARTSASGETTNDDQTVVKKDVPVPSDTNKQTEDDCVPKIFSSLFPCRLNASEIAVLKKHYHAILRSLPSDHMTSLGRLSQVISISDTVVDRIISCSTSQESNGEVLDALIDTTAADGSLVKFCNAVEEIVGSRSPTVESLRSDCLKVLEPSEGTSSAQQTSSSITTAPITTAPITTASQPFSTPVTEVTQQQQDTQSSTSSQPTLTSSSDVTSTTVATGTQPATSSAGSLTANIDGVASATEGAHCEQRVMTADDSKAALRTFDEYLHLMKLVEPQCIQLSLQTAELFPSNADAATLSSFTLIEKLINEVRSSIELSGVQKFLTFVKILQTDGRYSLLGYHIFNTYRLYGGHGVLTSSDGSSLSGLPTVDLSEQLKWHQKQLQAGLQYQCPLPLPDYYIQRDQLLEAIVNKLTEDDGLPTVGTTVTISGVGGVGKSTLAKALCHDLQIRNCFLDGFLWIRLGPLPISPAIKLGQLYYLLTNRTEVGNQTFFTDKLQSLVTSHLHKLLVIIDDVWEVSDALVYTQVFNGCKIIMTTRRENVVNKLITSKMCMTIERMNEEEAIKLLTYNLPKQISVKDANYLVQSVNYFPLLLNMVSSQLVTYCTKQNKPPEQAMGCIHNKLTKIDPGNDIDKSVVAVIESSMELLTTDELHALEKLVLSVGYYMPIPVTVIPTILKVSGEEADRLCRKLVELWLLMHRHFTIAPNNSIVHCYEVHPAVAQYVFDHVKFKSPAELADVLDLGDFVAISKALAGRGDKSDITYHYLAMVTVIDMVILPSHISSLFAIAKCLQDEINDCATKLSLLCVHSGNPDLTRFVDDMKENNTFKCVKTLHETIREDCRNLHCLLVSNKHDEATQWLTSYVKNHPLRTFVGTFTTFVKDLLGQCQDDQPLIASISSHSDRMIQFYKTALQTHTQHAWITLRRGLIDMINSGDVTLEQYQNLLDCHRRDLELVN